MDRSLLIHTIKQQPGGPVSSDSSSSSSSVLSLELNVDDYVNNDHDVSLTDYKRLYLDLAGLLMLFDSQIGSKIGPAENTGNKSMITGIDVTDPLRAGPVHHHPRNPLVSTDVDDYHDHDRLRDPRGHMGMGGSYPRRGDFSDDLNPLGGAGSGGNLMGPRNFPYPGQSGGAVGGVPVPGMAPRFDPYGPVPGMGDPDFDELIPPGLGGPQRGPRGPFGGPPTGRGGFGGGGRPFI